MDEWLTTKQVMDLLQLDRTTIYRMLNDGRLAGARVGGQWRFSRDAIEAILQGQRPAPRSALPSERSSSTEPEPDSSLLPLHCIEPIQQVFAATSQTGVVLADPEGEALIPPSNTCAFCDLIRSTKQGRARCQSTWREAGPVGTPSASLVRCHAGLNCVGGWVNVRNKPIALCVSGQFALEGDPPVARQQVDETAQACKVDASALYDASASVRVLSQAQAERLPELVGMLAATYAAIAEERLDVITRLKQVAQLAEAGI